MIETLAKIEDFNIHVAAYPYKHPEVQRLEKDVELLKRKIDAGACGALIQFIFEAEDFFHSHDLCEKSGIHAPVMPGILFIETALVRKRLRIAAVLGFYVLWMQCLKPQKGIIGVIICLHRLVLRFAAIWSTKAWKICISTC